MSLEAEAREFASRITNLERELNRLEQQEQCLRTLHEQAVQRQMALLPQRTQQYVELEEQAETLVEQLIDVVQAEVIVDELLARARSYQVTLRRYLARLRRSQDRQKRR